MSLRDLLLTILLTGGLPVALARPFIGALIFAFISLANPHRFTWGFAYSMPWAFAYAAATSVGLFGTVDKFIGDSIKRYAPILLYIAWMGITTATAFETTDAQNRYIDVLKVHVMCLITLMLLTDWNKIRKLTWVSAGSIAFFGLKGGIFTLLTGGQYLVWGPPSSAIQDNNHLAVGLVMMLPILYWMYQDTPRRSLRALIVLTGLMTTAAILGSHSRSAFLAIIAMSFVLLFKSRRKVQFGLIAMLVGMTSLLLMPNHYWERMESIQHYEQDASAMGRINTWKTAINIANDRITGAGFEYYTPKVFQRYAPVPDDIHSSHSIFFQALGEHGWPGLILFLTVWIFIWKQCARIARAAGKNPDERSQVLLARMLQVSIVGYAVGGSFVNIGNWDMAYYLAIIALALSRTISAKSTLESSIRQYSFKGKYHQSQAFRPDQSA